MSTNLVLAEYDWTISVRQWSRFKSHPDLIPPCISFFEQAFDNMPDETRKQAWFGLHSDCISITLGNLWLAAITKTFNAYLILDEADNVGSWDFIPFLSTQKYTPLGLVVVSSQKIAELTETKQIWLAYAKACEKAFDSPISRWTILRNIRNKQKVCDVVGLKQH